MREDDTERLREGHMSNADLWIQVSLFVLNINSLFLLMIGIFSQLIQIIDF